MTADQLNVGLLKRACAGQALAESWLLLWQDYVHRIDDLVDEGVDRANPDAGRQVCAAFAAGIEVHTHPFWLAHWPELKAVEHLVNVLYADSAAGERSDTAWKREWADHNRHAAMEMVVTVARLCGGLEHARHISQEQRNVCHAEHHRKGVPC